MDCERETQRDCEGTANQSANDGSEINVALCNIDAWWAATKACTTNILYYDRQFSNFGGKGGAQNMHRKASGRDASAILVGGTVTQEHGNKQSVIL